MKTKLLVVFFAMCCTQWAHAAELWGASGNQIRRFGTDGSFVGSYSLSKTVGGEGTLVGTEVWFPVIDTNRTDASFFYTFEFLRINASDGAEVGSIIAPYKLTRSKTVVGNEVWASAFGFNGPFARFSFGGQYVGNIDPALENGDILSTVGSQVWSYDNDIGSFLYRHGFDGSRQGTHVISDRYKDQSATFTTVGNRVWIISPTGGEVFRYFSGSGHPDGYITLQNGARLNSAPVVVGNEVWISAFADPSTFLFDRYTFAGNFIGSYVPNTSIPARLLLVPEPVGIVGLTVATVLLLFRQQRR